MVVARLGLVTLVNPHQRSGYSDSRFARIYIFYTFYTAWSRNSFEGMDVVCPHTKKHKTLSKRVVFVTEQYIEDVRQDEKHVPDLLEAIMKPKLFRKRRVKANYD